MFTPAANAGGMSARLELRRANCHVRACCSDHLVWQHVSLVAAAVPTDPRSKVYAFRLALGEQQLVEGALVFCLHLREIGAKVREFFHQSFSIVEIGKRKRHAPHTSVEITAFNDSEEFLRGFILGYRNQLQARS